MLALRRLSCHTLPHHLPQITTTVHPSQRDYNTVSIVLEGGGRSISYFGHRGRLNSALDKWPPNDSRVSHCELIAEEERRGICRRAEHMRAKEAGG